MMARGARCRERRHTFPQEKQRIGMIMAVSQMSRAPRSGRNRAEEQTKVYCGFRWRVELEEKQYRLLSILRRGEAARWEKLSAEQREAGTSEDSPLSYRKTRQASANGGLDQAAGSPKFLLGAFSSNEIL
jgi:hypothetical protein